MIFLGSTKRGNVLVGVLCVLISSFCVGQTNIEQIEDGIYASQLATKSDEKEQAIALAETANNKAASTKNEVLIGRAKGNLGFVYYVFKDKPHIAIQLLDEAMAIYYKRGISSSEFAIYQKALVELMAKSDGATSIKKENGGREDNSLIITALLLTEIGRNSTAREILDSLSNKQNKNPCDNLKINIAKAFSLLKDPKKEQEALSLLQCCTKCYFSEQKNQNSSEYPFVVREYTKLYQKINKGYPRELRYAGIEVKDKQLFFTILDLNISPKGERIWKISDKRIEPKKIENSLIPNFANIYINQEKGTLIKDGISDDNIYFGYSTDIDSLLKNTPVKNAKDHTKCNVTTKFSDIETAWQNRLRDHFMGANSTIKKNDVIIEIDERYTNISYFSIGQKPVFRFEEGTNEGYRTIIDSLKLTTKTTVSKIDSISIESQINTLVRTLDRSISHEGLSNRTNYIITGSICNALITLLETSINQEKINDNKYYTVDADELSKLETLLIQNDERLKKPDLLSLSLDKNKIYTQTAKVFNKYTHIELLIGLKLIKALEKNLNSQQPKKTLMLSKDEYFGWLIGSINSN